MKLFSDTKRITRMTAAFLLTIVLLFSLAACGSPAADPNAGLYEAVSAEMGGITVNVRDVFEDGFSLELKNGGKAVFHYEGKSYSMKWSLDGDVFHAEGGGAVLDGTLSYGELQLENVLDSGLQILLVCEELTPQMLDGPGEIAEPENTGSESASVDYSGSAAEPEALPSEPVMAAFATLPVYDAKQTMAMSNWLHRGYCLIEDDMFYGRYFLQKAQHAPLVSLELRREGSTVKGGKWIVLDDSCWPNYMNKKGNTLFYLKCETGGNNCLSVARVNTDGSDLRVLYEGECFYLSLAGDRLYFTDADYRLLSIDLEGGDLQTVLSKEVYYPYLLNEDWVLYQDDADNESLHLYNIPGAVDIPLNVERSYDPILSGSLLFYTTVIEETHYLCRIDLASYEEVFDEAQGCHVPVFTPERSERPFDDSYLLDGTSIIDYITLTEMPMENWKEMESGKDNSRYIRFLSEDLMIVDVLGNSGGVKAIQFIDRATGTSSAIHWLH